MEALDQSVETLPKMHHDSHDQNIPRMMDCILDQNKKLKYLLGEKGHLHEQLVALEEQSRLKRSILSKTTLKSKSFRSAKSHYHTTRNVSVGN